MKSQLFADFRAVDDPRGRGVFTEMGQQHTELHFCHRTHRELNNVDPLTKEPLMNKDFSVSK
jgi:hypothetical protein